MPTAAFIPKNAKLLEGRSGKPQRERTRPDNPYRLTTLPNGARIASVEMPYMKSVSVGF